MVKINGVEATNTNEIKDVKPSIKEILDRMDNNYQSRHTAMLNNQNINQNYAKNFSPNQQSENGFFNVFNRLFKNDTYNTQNVSAMSANSQSASQNDDASNFLFNLLPILLSKDKTKSSSFKDSTQLILKEIIKKSNNPMLAKFMELLPKISGLNKSEQTANTQMTENAPKQKDIDDFVKAEDYQNQNEGEIK